MKNKLKSVRRYDGDNCFTFINCSIGAVFRFWLMTKLCGGSNLGMSDDKGGLMTSKTKQSVSRFVKYMIIALSIFFILTLFTGCAATNTFSEGFNEGRESVDPLCEDNYMKRCPEDGSDPYFTFWFKSKPKGDTPEADPNSLESEEKDEDTGGQDG